MGFVFLIPILLILGIIPRIILHFKAENSQNIHVRYQSQLDSLTAAGVELVPSPHQVFYAQDTVQKKSRSNTSIHENLNRIPFSEADFVILQIVPGVGPTLSGRIIKFHENLGGLYDSTQLRNVYGLKPEIADLIWDFFSFESGVTNKIKINEVSQEDLLKHPYVSYG
jgi:DNA uptake protein ComE-like DNA-binding protein